MITNLMLSGGPTHDFSETSSEVARLLSEPALATEPSAVTPTVANTASVTTTITDDPTEFFRQLRAAAYGAIAPWDLVTVYALRWRMTAERYEPQRNDWAYALDPADSALIDDHVRGGKGLLALHSAVICFDSDPVWRALVGAVWDWERSAHPTAGSMTVECTEASTNHPITAGVSPFAVVDEAYGFLDELDDVEPLLTSSHTGRAHPVLWARCVGAGRVVTDLLGHGMQSLAHPTHRTILRRSAAWAAGDLR